MLIITDTSTIIKERGESLGKANESDVICCFNEAGQNVDISFINIIRNCKAVLIMLPERYNPIITAYIIGKYSPEEIEFKLNEEDDVLEEIKKADKCLGLADSEQTETHEKKKENEKTVEDEPKKRGSVKGFFSRKSETDKKASDMAIKVTESQNDISPDNKNEENEPDQDVSSEPEQPAEEAEEKVSSADEVGFDDEYRPFEELSEEMDGEEFEPKDELDSFIYEKCKKSEDLIIKSLPDSKTDMEKIKEVVCEATDEGVGVPIMLGLKFDRRMAGKLTPFVKGLYKEWKSK